MKPNREAIFSHLSFLFSDVPNEYSDGKIEISWSAVATGAVNSSSYFNIDDLDAAADFVVQKNEREGVNVYVGAALRSPDAPPFGRSSLADYYASGVVWCDVDDGEAAKAAKDKYAELPPSFIVVTGRAPNLRFQAWWKLNEYETQPDNLKASLSGVCNALSGDAAVVDPARVMRIGGTIAWPKKSGRSTELTETITPLNSTKTTSIDALNSIYPPVQRFNTIAPQSSAAIQSRPLQAGRNTFTQTINIQALLEASRSEGQWHINMRDAIAAMVGRGWNDEQIRIATNPYLRDRSLVDDLISPLISSARKKWEKPDFSTDTYFNNYDEETGEIKNKFYYINGPDIDFDLDVNDFVQGLLCESAMSVVYGESNCGKTFFMTDLAFHIVEGRAWNNKRVEKGNVLYISLEGASGLKRRVEAFKREHNATLNGFLMMPCAVDFLSNSENSDINSLLELIKEAKNKLGDIKLIVVDTLARAMGGGDENSGQDMGLLVKHADFIKEHTGAHICFIHHSGKDKARGARGHSSLRAAVDTEIEIGRKEGADYSEVKIAKQRDLEIGETTYFKLKSIDLGINRHGESVKSCVVEPYLLDDTTDFVNVTIKSGKTRTAFDALIECIDENGTIKNNKNLPAVKVVTETDFKNYLIMRGVLSDNNKSASIQYHRIKADLIEHNLAVFRDVYVWSGR